MAGRALSDLHAQAVGNPSSIAILGTGISIELLAKLFKSTFSYKAPAMHIPTTPAAPVTKYHGGAAHVASMYSPQAIFVSFSSTASALVPAWHALAAHLNLASALKWASCASPLASDPGRCQRTQHPPPLLGRDALIGIMLKGNDGTVLKDGTKAVVGVFKNAAGGKVSKEELMHAVARVKF